MQRNVRYVTIITEKLWGEGGGDWFFAEEGLNLFRRFVFRFRQKKEGEQNSAYAKTTKHPKSTSSGQTVLDVYKP